MRAEATALDLQNQWQLCCSKSISALSVKARALGLTVYDEQVLRTNDGRVGREIGIVDFDDNLVVIYKILGEAK